MGRQAGLTLLELLLVVFILSVISFGAVSLIDTSDSQWRFEETKSRMARIRVAVVGEDEPVFAGQRRLAGFVADVGALPADLADLTGPPAAGDAAYQSCTPELEDGYQLSAHALFKGRRPPYLVLEASTDPSNPRYRDGWGTKSVANDALYHGWGWTVAADTLTVVSLGADGIWPTCASTCFCTPTGIGARSSPRGSRSPRPRAARSRSPDSSRRAPTCWS